MILPRMQQPQGEKKNHVKMKEYTQDVWRTSDVVSFKTRENVWIFLPNLRLDFSYEKKK